MPDGYVVDIKCVIKQRHLPVVQVCGHMTSHPTDQEEGVRRTVHLHHACPPTWGVHPRPSGGSAETPVVAHRAGVHRCGRLYCHCHMAYGRMHALAFQLFQPHPPEGGSPGPPSRCRPSAHRADPCVPPVLPCSCPTCHVDAPSRGGRLPPKRFPPPAPEGGPAPDINHDIVQGDGEDEIKRYIKHPRAWYI